MALEAAGARMARSIDDVLQTRPMASSLRNFELTSDNATFIRRLVDDIDGARHHVGAWMFSWQDDGAGTAVRDALIRAARRGVDVDVVVDGLGSRQLPFSANRKFLDELADEGATVARSWPLRREGVRLVRDGSDHMKLFEIDGRTAWTGGRNLAEKYDLWHDYMVRFEGPAAAVLGADQAGRVRELGGKVASSRMQALEDAWRAQASLDGLEPVTLLRTDPRAGLTEPRDELFRQIKAAKDSIRVTTPYFGSDEAGRLMREAAERGVRVELGVPGPNQWKNGQYAIHATRSYYPALRGVEVLEYPVMSHAKANAIDGATQIGSVNVGRRALELDRELMLAFPQGSRAGAVIEAQLAADLATGSLPPTDAGMARAPTVVRGLRRLTGIEQ